MSEGVYVDSCFIFHSILIHIDTQYNIYTIKAICAEYLVLLFQR